MSDQSSGEFIATAIPKPRDTTRIRLHGQEVIVTHVATYDWTDFTPSPTPIGETE